MRFTVAARQICVILLFHAVCHAKNSLEPTETDLACFNDYESEMKCHLSSKSCSEYKLNITHYSAGESKEYSCVFKAATDCECKVMLEEPGFIIGENYTVLLKGGNVLFVKKLETGTFLKPKTPVLKVQKTENGNFKVTWDTKYKSPKNFVDGLKIKLYGVIGKGQKEPLEGLNTVGFIEIISSNLDPKTSYSLTATMSTHYNEYTIESDESKPLVFTTPSSPNEILKIIPVVCVALITLIFIIFIMTFSIKRNWWDKISKPQINPDFDHERNINTMSPSIVPISVIRADILKSDLNKEKECTLSPVDTKSEKSSTSVSSIVGDYGEAGTEAQRVENILTRTERELNEVFANIRSAKLKAMSSTYSKLPVMTENHLGSRSQRERNFYNRDSGNCSGSSSYSNMAYAKSPPDSSDFFDELTCDTVYMNESTINSDNHPFGSDIGKTQSDDNSDEMLTRNKLTVSKNPLYPAHRDCNVIVCENKYQDKGIKQQWNSTTSTDVTLGHCGAIQVCLMDGHAPSLREFPWTRPLHTHILPNIEIIDAYHAV